ncbi:MAG TPA: SH3-like domain-containing protein [Chloroflexota bacterium]|nr:SH3-like domain-containing protein [Chloroflexota bacterium]
MLASGCRLPPASGTNSAARVREMPYRFAIGDRVRVKALYPPGHVRTPVYIRGKQGVITAQHGHFPNPEQLAYGRDGLPPIPLYGVTFDLAEVLGRPAGRDKLTLDIYEHWLEPA